MNIRTSILTGLGVVIGLIVAVGLSGVFVLREQASGSRGAVVGRYYEAVRALSGIRYHVAMINTAYLPALAGQPNASASPRTFEVSRSGILSGLAVLRRVPFSLEQSGALERIEGGTSELLELHQLAVRPTISNEARLLLHSRILKLTGDFAQSSEHLLSLIDQSMRVELARESGELSRAVLVLVLVLTAASALAAFVAQRLDAAIVSPIARLTAAAQDVRHHRYNLVIPQKRTDEIGELTVCFNEMAAEMRELLQPLDEKRLRSNRESRAILATFPHPIVILNGEGELSQVNPRAEELMEALGTPDRLPSKVRRLVHRVLEEGEDYQPEDLSEAIALRDDRKEYFFLPGIFRIQDENERPAGWAVVLNDVTRFRWLDTLKTDLIATVSHEIKTPLTSIRMALHLLAHEKLGTLNERQEKLVLSSRDDCERLLQTLGDLLQISRWESGARQLQTEPVSPKSLAGEAVDLAGQVAPTKRITIQVDVPDDLPPVLADRARIRQVFDNLLSNAMHYSPEGEVLTLRARPNGPEAVRFSVLDKGRGVPEEHQDRIFERFYRLADDGKEGVGLGLSICREIVHAHGGQIGVSSHVGEPTEFFFSLPVAA